MDSFKRINVKVQGELPSSYTYLYTCLVFELGKSLCLKCEKIERNNLRIMKKAYAYFQTMIKTPVKFQKNWHKTGGGVPLTRYLLHVPIHFPSTLAQKGVS